MNMYMNKHKISMQNKNQKKYKNLFSVFCLSWKYIPLYYLPKHKNKKPYWTPLKVTRIPIPYSEY